MNRRGIVRAHLGLFLFIAAVLFATTDDRFPGSTADGRQMIWTAVAIAETGELGQAPGRDLTVPRADGDSVSRFGLGMSVAQVPAALLAPSVESRQGPATSQPLFLIAPFVFVLTAAVFAGKAVRALGGSPATERVAIMLATFGSPLGVYAALDASESLQAACFMVACWSSVVAAQSTGRHAIQAALIAGAACGIALLTKSSLLVVAPLTLAPMMAGDDRSRQVTTGNDRSQRVTTGLPAIARSAKAGDDRSRRVTTSDYKSRLVRLAIALLTFAGFGAIWLYLEISRFGAPLMGYAGENFSHSPLDGFWRLLVGFNKGLLWYFPALVAVGIGAAKLFREGNAVRRLACVSAIGVLTMLLATASGWWAWHGDDGWGPRLLVAGIPTLAVCAALAAETWPAWARTAVIAVSVLMNLPALLQHPTPVFHYRLSAAWPQGDPATVAELPRFAKRDAGGMTLVVPDAVLAKVPQASPLIVLPWYFAATHFGNSSQRAEMLRQPPWIRARPDIAPSEALVASLSASPMRWPFWGRAFLAGGVAEGTGVYDLGLADQVLRAQTLRQMGRAETLARKLVSVDPGGYADALLLETFRLGRRRPEAVQYLKSLSRTRREEPAINVVLALFERDSGQEASAKVFLSSIVDSYPDSPVSRALSQPLAQWPRDFASMTKDDRLQVDIR